MKGARIVFNPVVEIVWVVRFSPRNPFGTVAKVTTRRDTNHNPTSQSPGRDRSPRDWFLS
jgi:hypothetical protein